MRPIPGNDLVLGQIVGRNANLGFLRSQRDKHLYITGGTGTGKSKFLESLVRQDIWNWRKSRCGMLVLDPHGELYDNLINWLAKQGIDRPVIPIDLRQDDWIVSYNLLRQRKTANPTVLVDNIIATMAYVWGQDGINLTPQFAQWAGNVLTALYENKRTLVEAELLFDRVAKEARHALTAGLKDKQVQQDWQLAYTLNAKDFDAQIGSTVRRLRAFIKNETLRLMFGQSNDSLDLGKALEQGSIILVSLATERAKVSENNAQLFGALLLNDLWTAAKERGKHDGIKPFYVYLDEFQQFITPTIAQNLDQARGFGLHFTMANQFPKQLLNSGEHGKRLYDSIMENASNKVVFRLSDRENLEPMAEWLFTGVLNPDEIKHKLYGTKVMEYREELKEVVAESKTSGRSRGSQRGRAAGSGLGGTQSVYEGSATNASSESWNDFSSESESENESRSENVGHSKILVPTIVSVLGKELAHIQYRTLEEQLFRTMAVLFDQKNRHGIARLVEMKVPASIRTTDVAKISPSPERTKRFLNSCYDKLPFVLSGDKAQKQVLERADKSVSDLLKEAGQEPEAIKRPIK